MTTVSRPLSNRAVTSVNKTKGITMKLIRRIQLINEALSRARMRQPQTANSEATRPARQITLSALRREQNRLLGL